MVSATIWVLAAAAVTAAVAHQISATRLIGEGDVFEDDVASAAEFVANGPSGDLAVRHARNHLGIEAVSLIDEDGTVFASTSQTLVGTSLSDPLLGSAVESGRFFALAAPTELPIEIDGVTEWAPGSVLYQAVAPLTEGPGFVMLHYDVTELLGRRVQPGELQPLTIQLVGLGLVFAILGAAVYIGHNRAARRHQAIMIESELLRAHSRELEDANLKLIEARRKAERALALAEEKMRIRSEFVLMINHELRTPLTSVVTGAELLRGADLAAEDQQEVLDSMVANGNRLGEIIDQILAVARIENQGLAYETENVSVEDVCDRTGATFIGGVEESRRLTVDTDVTTLGLILNSLADNARTHGASRVEIACTDVPTVDPMIEVGTRPELAVYFTVTDDGPGIDPEFLPRAFEKFEKNSFSSGTGLGLYLVRLMVEALSGAIAVTTSPEGTTFQVALPALVRERTVEKV